MSAHQHILSPGVGGSLPQHHVTIGTYGRPALPRRADAFEVPVGRYLQIHTKPVLDSQP